MHVYINMVKNPILSELYFYISIIFVKDIYINKYFLKKIYIMHVSFNIANKAIHINIYIYMFIINTSSSNIFYAVLYLYTYGTTLDVKFRGTCIWPFLGHP